MFVCMSSLVLFTYAMKQHWHWGTHSSSLCLCDSTMVAAVLSHLGRRGWVVGVRSLGVRCGVGRCPIPQRSSSETPMWQIGFCFSPKKDRATKRCGKWMNYCQSTAGTSLHEHWLGWSPPQWSEVPITWKKSGKKTWCKRSWGSFFIL